jgi:endoglucanase
MLRMLLLATCWLTATVALAADPAFPSAVEMNRQLGRGINMGNALDGPSEGAWGMKIEKDYFALMKQAGFQSVRIPVRWSAHAKTEAPYTIDATFLARVDEVVQQALDQQLVVVLNMHHYDEIYTAADEHETRFLALWKQIAEHYRQLPAQVIFEPLNEPHTKLDAKRWGELIVRVLAIIRQTNPQRCVMFGPTQWNNVHALKTFELPANDPQLIATFHYYLPFQFTHQGASWAKGSDAWLGRKWTGSEAELKELHEHFDLAAAWSKQQQRPLYMGEYGVYEKADMASRVAWTTAVTKAAAERGFSTGYWEFGHGFGVYDREKKAWRTELRDALLTPVPSTK